MPGKAEAPARVGFEAGCTAVHGVHHCGRVSGHRGLHWCYICDYTWERKRRKKRGRG